MIIISGGFHSLNAAKAALSIQKLKYIVTDSPEGTQILGDRVINTRPLLDYAPAAIGKIGRILKIKELELLKDQMNKAAKTVFPYIVRLFMRSDVRIIHTFSSSQEPLVNYAKNKSVLTINDFGIISPRRMNHVLQAEARQLGVSFQPSDSDRLLNEMSLYDVIIVPTRHVYNSFADNPKLQKRMRIIPYGVEDHFLRSQKHKERSGEMRQISIACTGSIGLRKGQYYLLKACTILRQQGVPVQLHLFGSVEPSFKQLFEQYSHICHEVRPIPNEDLPIAYRNVDLFVLPSLAEGMSRAVFEAMASGLVPVVTKNCGFNNVITHHQDGFFVREKNVDDIVSIVKWCYLNPLALFQISNAASMKASRYPWSLYQRRLAHLYCELGY